MLPFGKTISAQEDDSFTLQPVARKRNVSCVSLTNPTSAALSGVPQTLQMLLKVQTITFHLVLMILK